MHTTTPSTSLIAGSDRRGRHLARLRLTTCESCPSSPPFAHRFLTPLSAMTTTSTESKQSASLAMVTSAPTCSMATSTTNLTTTPSPSTATSSARPPTRKFRCRPRSTAEWSTASPSSLPGQATPRLSARSPCRSRLRRPLVSRALTTRPRYKCSRCSSAGRHRTRHPCTPSRTPRIHSSRPRRPSLPPLRARRSPRRSSSRRTRSYVGRRRTSRLAGVGRTRTTFGDASVWLYTKKAGGRTPGPFFSFSPSHDYCGVSMLRLKKKTQTQLMARENTKQLGGHVPPRMDHRPSPARHHRRRHRLWYLHLPQLDHHV